MNGEETDLPFILFEFFIELISAWHYFLYTFFCLPISLECQLRENWEFICFVHGCIVRVRKSAQHVRSAQQITICLMNEKEELYLNTNQSTARTGVLVLIRVK